MVFNPIMIPFNGKLHIKPLTLLQQISSIQCSVFGHTHGAWKMGIIQSSALRQNEADLNFNYVRVNDSFSNTLHL